MNIDVTLPLLPMAEWASNFLGIQMTSYQNMAFGLLTGVVFFAIGILFLGIVGLSKKTRLNRDMARLGLVLVFFGIIIATVLGAFWTLVLFYVAMALVVVCLIVVSLFMIGAGAKAAFAHVDDDFGKA